jgi:hypothetical protein
MCSSVSRNCLFNAGLRSISDPTTGPSLRRRRSVGGSSASGCRPFSSRRAVRGRTAPLRASTDDYGMNCRIESSLIHCGRPRCWWNAGGRHITGFGRIVPWAIVRTHRKPSRHVARESHCKWYNDRGSQALKLIQRQSMDLRKSIREIGEAVLLASENEDRADKQWR